MSMGQWSEYETVRKFQYLVGDTPNVMIVISSSFSSHECMQKKKYIENTDANTIFILCFYSILANIKAIYIRPVEII